MAQVIDINERRAQRGSIRLTPTLFPGKYRVSANPETRISDVRAVARGMGGVVRTDLRGGLVVELPMANNWQPDGAA